MDASAVLSWLFEQQYAEVDAFWQSLAATDNVIAAQLLLPECTSVLRRSVFMKRMTRPAASLALQKSLAMPFQLVTDVAQFTRAFDLANRFQHKKAYDMQHLAVAELTNSTLITRDRGLRHAATRSASP